MGIERARVVEVHAPSSATKEVGSGYVVGDRLVLTVGRIVGRNGATHVRQAGTAVWTAASVAWAPPSGIAAVLEIDDPSMLMLSPDRTPLGRITGKRPVAVTAMGFPPSATRPDRPRDPRQFLGHVVPGDDRGPLAVTGSNMAGAGMSGAALLAGAELVGLLVADGDRLQAEPVTAMAGHQAFVELFGSAGGLELTPVSAPSFGLPIL